GRVSLWRWDESAHEPLLLTGWTALVSDVPKRSAVPKYSEDRTPSVAATSIRANRARRRQSGQNPARRQLHHPSRLANISRFVPTLRLTQSNIRSHPDSR